MWECPGSHGMSNVPLACSAARDKNPKPMHVEKLLLSFRIRTSSSPGSNPKHANPVASSPV